MRMRYVPVFDADSITPDRRVLAAKLLLRPDEAAAILRISRSMVYAMAADGRLESVRIGGSLRIRSSSVSEMIEKDSEP